MQQREPGCALGWGDWDNYREWQAHGRSIPRDHPKPGDWAATKATALRFIDEAGNVETREYTMNARAEIMDRASHWISVRDKLDGNHLRGKKKKHETAQGRHVNASPCSRSTETPTVQCRAPTTTFILPHQRKASTAAPHSTSHPVRAKALGLCEGEVKEKLIEKVLHNQVTIIHGQTGCGKSTQVPQILLNALPPGSSIAITQPRVVAAVGLATRVAEEMNVAVGTVVGYRTRYESAASKQTRLTFLTDGLLLRQFESDRELTQYACIIIDEAHERTTSTDVLLPLLKGLIGRRNDFKLVIMSATLNLGKFCNYFASDNVFEAHSSVYTVFIKHLHRPCAVYEIAAEATVQHIIESRPPGDILVFLTSVREIDKMVIRLKNRYREYQVLPMYSALPKRQRHAVTSGFDKPTIVISTNVAEASLTIPGIRYVVDCGLKVERGYNPRLGMSTLLVTPVSRDSGRQRAGRAGRQCDGEVYRLYTKQTHDEFMLAHATPDLHNESLTHTFLRLKCLGFDNIPRFDFLDAPHPEMYLRAIGELLNLGLIDNDLKVNWSGKLAAKLPVRPQWYRCLVKANALGCLDQMITIVAIMETRDDLLARPHAVRYVAETSHRAFGHADSDVLARLNAMNCFTQMKLVLSATDLIGWCNEYFVDYHAAEQALELREQIRGTIESQFLSAGKKISRFDETDALFSVNIQKSLVAGFFAQAGFAVGSGDKYNVLRSNEPYLLDPNLCLTGVQIPWVICLNLHYGGVQYLQYVTAIEPEWLLEVNPDFINLHVPKHHSGEYKNSRMVASLQEAAKRVYNHNDAS
ncbi:hypothetical protein H9Q72_009333 [Fusarium xylarioides]|uniref:Uncharacterized protein n=1 Tax=Fusarium xylarioides TaxID=221167 RepID=A0A9P7L391_9HYPO|nr:hypothetical protein H9Q70_006140 [Fusarium xylarioides]KAG5762551.1 hypothetical protein H9Q72_009333 [Fusarium xylarioides]